MDGHLLHLPYKGTIMKRYAGTVIWFVILISLGGCTSPTGDDRSGSTNAPPAVSLNTDNAVVDNGIDFTFEVTASDPDGDTLGFTWYVDNAVVDGETENCCVFNYSPAVETEYLVKVTVSDGTVDVSRTAVLTVRAPLGVVVPGSVPLSQDSVAEGYISVLDEEDWYAVTLTEGELLRITLTQPESEVDPDVRLYTPFDIETDVWRTYTLSEPAEIESEWQLAETSGDYYLRVTSANDHYDPSVPYTLSVATESEPEPADREPVNNAFSGAVLLATGRSDGGYISHETDEDWYFVSLSAGDLIQITATQPDSPVDPHVELFAPGVFSSEMWKKYTLNEPAEIVSEWQLAEEDGDYHLRVTSANDHTDPATPYAITVIKEDEPEDAGREPANNDYSGAVALVGGDPVEGYISHEKDEDWYVITVAAGATIQINVTQPTSPVEPAVDLYGPGNFTTALWDKYTLTEPAEILSPPQAAGQDGNYYMCITSANDHSDPYVPYTLTVTVSDE